MFKYPTYKTKYASNGVIPFVIDSEALNINCEYCGDKFICIIAGTNIGDMIIHFVIVLGTKRFDIEIISTENIIKIIPDNGNAFSKSVKSTTINVPILVSLNIAINCDAKNTNAKIIPKFFRLSLTFSTNSLSFFTDFAPIA